MKSLFSPLLLVVVLTFCVAGLCNETSSPQIISIAYQELADALDGNSMDACPRQSLLTAVAEAFGPNGLGILEITNIPQHLVDLRTQVLSMAHELATLPTSELDHLTLPETDYTIGWSHGKEQFGLDDSGRPIYDTRKGSFYVDPFRDHNNIFPTTSIPSLEPALLEVTRAMSQVTLWVSQLCDAYLQNEESLIYNSLKSRINTKARLLYYFPNESEQTNLDDDDWCGWHKDHGSLTALLPGMLLKEQAIAATTTKSKPGLYIQTRDGSQIPIQLPPTSLGIQLGETVEIMSGGRLVATPHAVMSKGMPMGGRASLAVFLQPELDQVLPDCPTTADPSLQARHRPTFGAFQEATTKAFQ